MGAGAHKWGIRSRPAGGSWPVAPALIGYIPRHFGSSALQFGKCGVNVVTHEVKLMVAAAVSWMDGELGGRQSEDKPASARVHRRQAEHVPEERTDLLSFGREHDRVHACDHAVLLASAWQATALRRTRCRCVAQSGSQAHLPRSDAQPPNARVAA